MKTVRRNSMVLLLLLMAAAGVKPQEKVWLKLEKGEAVVFDPVTAGWKPVGATLEVPRRTFLLAKEKSAVNVFVATDMYRIGENSYVFIEDAIAKTRSQLVAELTRIEVEQLPNSDRRKDSLETMDVGLTYGKVTQPLNSEGNVLFKKERLAAVNSFIAANRSDAAVLTLKRMLSRYPSLYFERPIVEQLFGLYKKLELDGFLFDESSKLMGMINNEDYSRILIEWNNGAKDRLAKTKNK